MDQVVNKGGDRRARCVCVGKLTSRITHRHCTQEASHQERVGHLEAFCGLSGRGVPMGARHSHVESA